MKRLQNHLIGVEQGDVSLFSDFESEGPMWTQEGEREVRRAVSFEHPFRNPPAVHAVLSMWDVADGSNTRLDISVDKVNEAGFEIVFRTWADTRVARARASWIAIGELDHPDDWSVD